MAPNHHNHAEDCRTLARARIMALRAQMRLNDRIREAMRRHDADLVEIVSMLERRVMRVNAHDFVFMTPPRLQRQTAENNPQERATQTN